MTEMARPHNKETPVYKREELYSYLCKLSTIVLKPSQVKEIVEEWHVDNLTS